MFHWFFMELSCCRRWGFYGGQSRNGDHGVFPFGSFEDGDFGVQNGVLGMIFEYDWKMGFLIPLSVIDFLGFSSFIIAVATVIFIVGKRVEFLASEDWILDSFFSPFAVVLYL